MPPDDEPFEHRALAEKLRELMEIPQWKAFVDMSITMMNDWNGHLVRLHDGLDTIEKIALDRIRWAGMSSGVKAVFVQMDELIFKLNEVEKEESEQRKEKEHG
jgi:hypothetical protein